MRKLFALGALAALSSFSAFAAELNGVIADSKCKHVDGTEKSIACTEKCVKGGADAVFVASDGKVYKIASDSKDKVTPHLGHKVTVTGSVAGDTLSIDSIKM